MKKITIGRAAENDIVFKSVDTVSNYHSEILIDEYGTITYCDHSTNGSKVNGISVHNSSCMVKVGDEIVLPGNSIVDWKLISPIMQTNVVDHVPVQQHNKQSQSQASAYQQYSSQPQQQASAYQQYSSQPQQQAPAYQQYSSQPQQQAPAYQQYSSQPQQQAPAYQQYSSQPQQQYQEYRENLPTKRGLLKMIVFGMLTFGIYNIVIYCKISSEINIVARADHRHTMHYLLVCLLAFPTMGILPIIWTHNICNRIGCELKRRNIPYDFGSGDFWMWGVLGALILVGPSIFLHKFMHAMNKLNGSYNMNGE